jgi:polysaccharide biosynthesis transport protein
LNSAKQHQVYTQTLLDQYRSVQVPVKSDGGAPSGLAEIDQQLDTLKAKLADLSTQYTDRYPEVKQVKEEIAKTEKEREEAIASLKSKTGSTTEGSEDAQVSENPAQSAALLQLQSQLKADQLEISNREQAISSLRSRINDYQTRLSAEPAVEQQLTDLNRGYEQSQANYNDLLKKENDSQIATSMEQMQEGERFTMIDPPSLPLKPDFPNRLKMCGAGLGIGTALGALLVAGLEFFDDRLHSEKQIQTLLPITVIAEVPEIVTPSDMRRDKMRLAVGWAAAAFVFLTILGGSAFSFLHR